MTETITVVGNITEPEYKTIESGLQILNFRLASTERRYDKAEGRWIEGVTSWYSVSAFHQLAENASRSFRKGDRVLVTGRLRLRDWETAAKKGVTAQIDADALGHDLRWGSTMFHRVSSPSQEAAQKDPAWATSGATADGWGAATPGEGADDRAAPESAESSPGDDARELVTAAGETPF